MEKYFAIFEKEEKFSPVSLQEGILHTVFNIKKPFEPLDSDSGEWRRSINKKVELPNCLWFVTRDRKYAFDLRYDSGGFFMSENMMLLLKEFEITNFVSTPLKMLNKKGESVSDKQYFYVKFFGSIDLIDYPNSKIDFDKNGHVKKPWEISLKLPNESAKDLFLIDNWFFLRRLFCNEKFRDRCIESKLIGIQFVDAKDAGTFKV